MDERKQNGEEEKRIICSIFIFGNWVSFLARYGFNPSLSWWVRKIGSFLGRAVNRVMIVCYVHRQKAISNEKCVFL